MGLSSCTQPDTVAPTDSEVHSSAREEASLLEADGFESGRLGKFWRTEFRTATAGQFADEQSRAGKKALRISWKPSQYDGGNPSMHSELLTTPLPVGETERWYGYSSYMPSGSMANDSDPVIVSQWHGVPDPGFSDTVPPVAIYLNPDNKLTLVYRACYKPITALLQHPTSQKFIDLGVASFDKWVDYVVHVKWDPIGKTGTLEVWQDGVKKVNEQNISIGYLQINKPYWKLGLYAWTGKSSHTERVHYCDEVRIGGPTANYDAVKPGRGNNSARTQQN